MLTKIDLAAIGQLIDEKVTSRLIPIQKGITTLQKDVRKIKKDLARTSDFLDREILKDRKRIDKLEKEVASQRNYI